jgi:7tm Chemosensory receptor
VSNLSGNLIDNFNTFLIDSLQAYYQYSHIMYAVFFKTTLSWNTIIEGVSIIPFLLLTLILHVIAHEKCIKELKRTVRLVENVQNCRTNKSLRNTVEMFLVNKAYASQNIMVHNMFPISYETMFGVRMKHSNSVRNNKAFMFQFCLSILSNVIVMVQFDLADAEEMLQKH